MELENVVVLFDEVEELGLALALGLALGFGLGT